MSIDPVTEIVRRWRCGSTSRGGRQMASTAPQIISRAAAALQESRAVDGTTVRKGNPRWWLLGSVAQARRTLPLFSGSRWTS
jgi:hypothetical protein